MKKEAIYIAHLAVMHKYFYFFLLKIVISSSKIQATHFPLKCLIKKLKNLAMVKFLLASKLKKSKALISNIGHKKVNT